MHVLWHKLWFYCRRAGTTLDLPLMGDHTVSNDTSRRESERFDWQGLRVFLHVAESGNLSGAAKALGISQPEVARSLRDLEERMNMQLFTRTPSGLALTEGGTSVRDLAKSMQRSASAVGALLKENDRKAEGRVRIFMPQGVAAFWIAPRLPRFLMSHPGVTVRLTTEDGDRDRTDIAVQYDERRFGEYLVEPLATVHFALFASRAYCERHGTPATLADLADHATVQLTAEHIQRVMPPVSLEGSGSLADASIQTDCAAALLMTVLAAGGFAPMPTCAASFAPNLVMLGERPIMSPVLYLVIPPDRAETERVQPIVQWLREVFDPRANPWFRSEFIHPRTFSRAGVQGVLSFDPPP